MPWWLKEPWYWFWYYRHGKVEYWVWRNGDGYSAFASNGKKAVGNCYGSTPENAKAIALFHLNKPNAESET